MVSEHVVLGPSSGEAGLPENPRDYALPGNQDPATPWPSPLVLLSAIAAATTRGLAGLAGEPWRGTLLVRSDLDGTSAGTVFVNGSAYGPAGGGSCTGALVSYLPCNSLIGEIGYGPYFAIPNTSYLHVFQSGQLKLAVNTPSGASSLGAFRVSVVALP
jgi:hypothetical protein